MSRSIYAQYVRYTVPTVMAMLVSGLYQIIDGIFIGQFVGGNGLAAVNIVWSIAGAIIGIGLLIGVGAGALTSIYRGERKFSEAKRVLATGILLILCFSVLASGFILLFAQSLLRLQTHDGTVLDLAIPYLRILVFSTPVMLGSIVFPFLIRNDDSPQFATWLMLIGAVINIVLDYIFIGPLSLQLKGAAFATVIAQLTVCLIGLAYFYSPRATLNLKLVNWSFQYHDIKRIVIIGLSSFFMYLYWGVMVAFHNHQFDSYGGTSALGAYAILGYIVTFYYLMIEGCANGMQPLASYQYGARQYHNIRILVRLALSIVMYLGLGIFLVLLVFPETIVSVFTLSDMAVKQRAINGIPLHMFALCLDGFIVVVAAFYQSINQGRKAMVVTLGNMAIQPPFLFVLPHFLGLSGVWLAYPLSNMTLSLLLIYPVMKDIRQISVRHQH